VPVVWGTDDIEVAEVDVGPLEVIIVAADDVDEVEIVVATLDEVEIVVATLEVDEVMGSEDDFVKEYELVEALGESP
jgi:predicted transcriptional regulator